MKYFFVRKKDIMALRVPFVKPTMKLTSNLQTCYNRSATWEKALTYHFLYNNHAPYDDGCRFRNVTYVPRHFFLTKNICFVYIAPGKRLKNQVRRISNRSKKNKKTKKKTKKKTTTTRFDTHGQP